MRRFNDKLTYKKRNILLNNRITGVYAKYLFSTKLETSEKTMFFDPVLGKNGTLEVGIKT